MAHDNHGPATGGVRFKTGVVSAVDGAGNVRVTFEDIGVQSFWLPVCYPKTQDDKAFWTPDAGEQVRCIMDEHLEDGTVLGAIYSAADSVPWSSGDVYGWLFKDGGGFSYNRSTGELDVNVKGNTTVTIGGDANINVAGALNVTSGGTATLKAGETVIDGNLRVKGATMLEGGVGGAAGASTVIPGSILAENDVKAGDVSLHDHEHDDPEGGTTSKPIPS
ncbi:phage baseplate assembly protein V [Burkholderia sp. Ac-20345]|uniref:phage baseplate assembly protein V n=1 Tax=Burkholderia sp. Ac-20345 TaxID=2703891 RepID=UPI00197C3BD5|nr:phage baseplate assembly protein V [Burkholderia sp. Ac-20345]MBN3779913.1 phage baseplate assembly protein V [Burkholderia sp. Ac-20345]